MNEEFTKAVNRRKKAAIAALFDYLFLIKHDRLPSYWEARMGEALVYGEITCNRPPSAIGLRQVHQVAAEVADALTTSESVMASNR